MFVITQSYKYVVSLHHWMLKLSLLGFLQRARKGASDAQEREKAKRTTTENPSKYNLKQDLILTRSHARYGALFLVE